MGHRSQPVGQGPLYDEGPGVVGLNGFSARVVWTAGGTVTHFGHRHFRQNSYDARVALASDDNVWKIHDIEIFDEQRLR